MEQSTKAPVYGTEELSIKNENRLLTLKDLKQLAVHLPESFLDFILFDSGGYDGGLSCKGILLLNNKLIFIINSIVSGKAGYGLFIPRHESKKGKLLLKYQRDQKNRYPMNVRFHKISEMLKLLSAVDDSTQLYIGVLRDKSTHGAMSIAPVERLGPGMWTNGEETTYVYHDLTVDVDFDYYKNNK